MAHKTENWQEALLRVREGLKEANAPVEKTEDEVISEEIDGLLNDFEGTPAEEIVEITDKEINAVKKLSKDIEKIKKDYFKIAKLGDKTLKDTKFNKKYESILKAQQEILSLIGELSNQKMMQDG